MFLGGTCPAEWGQRRPLVGCKEAPQHLARKSAGRCHILTYCCFLSDSNLVISSLSLLISFSS